MNEGPAWKLSSSITEQVPYGKLRSVNVNEVLNVFMERSLKSSHVTLHFAQQFLSAVVVTEFGVWSIFSAEFSASLPG